MGTPHVRIDTRLNKAVWAKGIRNAPDHIRVQLSRKHNEDEDLPNKLYTLVNNVPVTAFKNLDSEKIFTQGNRTSKMVVLELLCRFCSRTRVTYVDSTRSVSLPSPAHSKPDTFFSRSPASRPLSNSAPTDLALPPRPHDFSRELSAPGRTGGKYPFRRGGKGGAGERL
ncbi:hypothetical protein H8959_015147 [Pygathrix nigripes]